ncbi:MULTISPECIES: FMN-dependent NADH-azoreductase [unclassified Amycolatopsis]|uniref:FMN-dependent NADH-azoreductase n=1 Tax=unclassified Amycolatopsis TaxID=2618356 RepID=UPI001C6A6BDA|nr:NAD(P)H-dependent oxidoreductase [Amycolatopsis sp. DSM 110486]QYN21350.1 NAD(P)H-dependent oxidoreductase [Amycolatopsis sp. DSM 110486]
MPTLLHLDSSIWPTGTSTSRDVTATFRGEWEAQHPHGTVIHRDLAADPLPHLTDDVFTAGNEDPLRVTLARELEQADVVLIAAPMYNLTVPSTLKAWIDQVMVPGRVIGEQPSAAGTPVVVVSSRGSTYRPGTPRDGRDFVVPYLTTLFATYFGITEVEFIIPELTSAVKRAWGPEPVRLYEASRVQAHEDAITKAKELAARFA